jgi:hypothetical protein
MDKQLEANWREAPDALAHRLRATDIAFAKPEDLQRLYPLLFHHALKTFGRADILRFLGKKLTPHGAIPGQVDAVITSDLKRQEGGVRIQHRYKQNSISLRWMTKPTSRWAACCAPN